MHEASTQGVGDMKPEWLMTEDELNVFFEFTDTGADYWNELAKAQAKKIIGYLRSRKYDLRLDIGTGMTHDYLMKDIFVLMLKELGGKE
jgi:hypothetical protein